MGRVARQNKSGNRNPVVTVLLFSFRLVRWCFRLFTGILRWIFKDIRHLPQRIRYSFYRGREWLRQTSLRKALVAYVILGLLAALAATMLTILLISHIINTVTYQQEQSVLVGTISLVFAFYSPTPGLINLLHILGVFLPVLYIIGGIVGAGAAFYHFKLKTPLGILNDSARKIAANNLDFQIFYPIRDEMGELVDAFEKMRRSLELNNREMWRMMEEHRRLNAAFAHDLRTPLTVLRGYSDFLTAYVPEGKVSEEKLLNTLSTMSQHISRLESYAKTMNTVQKLEDITPEPEECNAREFFSHLSSSLYMLSQQHQVEIMLEDQTGLSSFSADSKIVEEVVENLVSNALCYAQKKISVIFTAGKKYLRATVEDDGRGFSPEDLQKAKKAFYKDSAHANSNHFGLGLNICDILCGKHGGRLVLENSSNGGAAVSAVFAYFPVPSKNQGEPASQDATSSGA